MMRRERASVLTAALVVVLLATGAPVVHAKSTWTVDAKVVNNTGSAADNCGPSSGVGCLFAPNFMGEGSVDDVKIPTSPIAAGDSGSFGFTSPGVAEGGDMYIDYTMPDGSEYYVIAEDDVDAGGYPGGGNYVACSEAELQNDIAAVCSAEWGGSYSNMTPTITFGPSSQAPLPSVGQRCSGTMGGADPVVIDCVETGQVGPPDPDNEMMISVQTLTQGAMYVNQGTGKQGCRVGTGYGTTCTMFTEGNSFQIGSLDNASSAYYSVEIIAAADGYEVPDSLPPDPNKQLGGSAPRLRALDVSPAVVHPARARAARTGARLSYRNTRNAMTLFSLARATRGVRRGGSCVRSRSRGTRGRGCTHWVTLPHRDVQSSVVGSGVKRAGHCRPAPSARPPGARHCRYRSGLRGHFLHRDRVGRNTVRFTGRIAGRRLRPGRYRLTARSRASRTSLTSDPVRRQFRVAH